MTLALVFKLLFNKVISLDVLEPVQLDCTLKATLRHQGIVHNTFWGLAGRYFVAEIFQGTCRTDSQCVVSFTIDVDKVSQC